MRGFLERLRRKDNDRGLTTLELVVVFPALFTFILFDIQVAMYHYARQVFMAAAAEGARVQAAGGNGTAAANSLLNYSGGSWVTGTATQGIVTDNLGNPIGVRIIVTGHINPIMNITLNVSQSAAVVPDSFTHG